MSLPSQFQFHYIKVELCVWGRDPDPNQSEPGGPYQVYPPPRRQPLLHEQHQRAVRAQEATVTDRAANEASRRQLSGGVELPRGPVPGFLRPAAGQKLWEALQRGEQ